MKKLMIVAAAFAFFAGSAMACDSCAAHAKKDKKECPSKKCDKDEKKCDKEAKKCDKEANKKDCDKCPSKK